MLEPEDRWIPWDFHSTADVSVCGTVKLAKFEKWSFFLIALKLLYSTQGQVFGSMGTMVRKIQLL